MFLKNLPIELFFKKNKGKKIACYGIGNEFEKVTTLFNDLPWRTVSYLVDNDTSKWGKIINIQDKNFKISDPDEIFSVDIPDVILVLPTKKINITKEILNKLDEDERLYNSECYLYYLMKMETGYENIPIKKKGDFLIPPVIHYCWLGRKPMPDLYKRCIESWRTLCPNYKIVEWNEDNLNLDENNFAKEAYECGKYGFVPDYFRLKIIYEYGGIYLDTDVQIIKNLDDLRREIAFCGMDKFGRAAFGLGFGATAGNKEIGQLMQTYKNIHFSTENMEEVLSPWIQTRDLMKMGMVESNRYQRVGDLTIFPTEVLSPKNPASFDLNITPYTYSIHHFDGSWATDERKNRCAREQAEIQALLKRCKISNA